MPNLTSYIDTSEYYHVDIRRYYDFIELEIDLDEFKLLQFEGSDMHLYLLTDNNDDDLALIRLVKVAFHGKQFYQISKSFSLKPRKGYGEILYNLCFGFYSGSLVSDHVNTLPGSYNLWKKILRKNGGNAIRYDSKNDRKFPIDLNDESLIWGVPDDFRNEILKTPWQAVIFENEYDEVGYGDNDETFEESFVDYLSENDKIERTILSDYIVEAFKQKRQIRDRHQILILM